MYRKNAIRGNAALRNAIREQKKDVTKRDVATSPAFKSMLGTGISTILKFHDITRGVPDIMLDYDERSAMTAATDDVNIYLNAAHRMFCLENGEEIGMFEYYSRILGTIFHEIGHIIYTPFTECRQYGEEILNGKITTGTLPLTEELKEAKKEVTEALGVGKGYLIFQAFQSISNCTEDGRIEKRLLANDSFFRGFWNGLRTLRSSHQKMLANIFAENECKKVLGCFQDMILYYAKFGDLEYLGEFEEFEDAKPIIDQILDCDDPKRLNELNAVLLLIAWTFAKDEFDTPESENSVTKTILLPMPKRSATAKGSKQSLPESMKKQTKANNQSREESDASNDKEEEKEEANAPNGTNEGSDGSESSSAGGSEGSDGSESSSAGGSEGSNGSESSSAGGSEGSNGSESSSCGGVGGSSAGDSSESNDEEDFNAEDAEKEAEALFEMCRKEIAEEKLNEEIEKNAISGLNKIVQTKFEKSLYDVHINEGMDAPFSWESIVREVEATCGKSLKKAAREIVRHYETDMQTGASRNRFYGTKFHAESLANRDFRYFESKGRAKDVPDMAVALCIDESGSMFSIDNAGRRRYQDARAAAICLYLLFEQIPRLDISIVGHTQYDSGAQIFPYADFGLKSKDTLKHLAGIDARSGNLDAIALKLMCERLLEQPAEVKMLIMISDGEPYNVCFEGNNSVEKELKDLADYYKSQGIEIVEAAIGEDVEKIRNIYQNHRVLDITDTSRIPLELVNTIKRKL